MPAVRPTTYLVTFAIAVAAWSPRRAGTARHLTSPVAGRVLAGASMHVARASHTATLLANGRVLVAGGFAGSGTESHPYQSTELYDPTTGAFTEGPPMQFGRSGHTATRLRTGQVLLAGGWTGPFDAQGTAELYDPVTNRVTRTGALTEPRAGQTATALTDGRVLLVGGVDTHETALASAELYDPTTGRFTPTGRLHAPRSSHTATRLADGRVLIVGGGSGRYPAQRIEATAELYDPATGQFTETGRLTTARHKHAAVRLADGQVLVVGGSDARDWRGQVATAERYDPARGTFTAVGRMRQARFKLPNAVTLLPSGRVLIAGGGAAAEVFDPRRMVFLWVDGSLGASRFFSAATLLPDGRTLITGGYAEVGRGLPSSAQAYLYAAR